MPQGGQALAERAEAGQPDGRGCNGQASPLGPGRVRCQEGQGLGSRRKSEGSQQAGQAGPGCCVVAVILSITGVGRLRRVGPGVNLESGVPDGFHCRQRCLRLAGYAQAALAQLEA